MTHQSLFREKFECADNTNCFSSSLFWLSFTCTITVNFVITLSPYLSLDQGSFLLLLFRRNLTLLELVLNSGLLTNKWLCQDSGGLGL